MEQLRQGWVLMVTLAVLVATVAGNRTLSVAPPQPNQTLPGCTSTCGDIQIPYPFGIGNSSTPNKEPCFLEHRFELRCVNSQLILGKNIPVLSINVSDHRMDVLFYVSSFCGKSNDPNKPSLKIPNFSISSKENKFLTIGCDSFGYLNSYYNNESYSTGCLTRCYGHTRKILNGTCSGIGCCQVDIPPGMRNISIKASTFPNSTEYSGNCSYSFVVKQDSYNFSASHLHNFPNKSLPLVLDWTVGNRSCRSHAMSKRDYACRDNSNCDDTDSDYGYRCKCKPGYDGNPYLGCTDINECTTPYHTCINEKNCRNTIGNYSCFCDKWWQSGNGRIGEGCHVGTMVFIGAGVGMVILFMVVALLHITYQKKKFIKLKRKFYEQNGGLILEQKLSRIKDSSQAKHFTEKELKDATNNFDESLIIGKGGSGTVFKGFLADNRIVAIKKSRTIDESQKDEFINEVVVLSKINHRNVVKLLGCCLETKVPLLVYEFVNNGTLFDYLHKEGNASNISWKTRLRIASEAAGALSHLHSTISIPIIHGDVKCANILLDDNYTAKVSDFGASRLVELDQNEIARGVPGTFGYIDPEAIQTNQLSEKSDVYSFGIVLVELITGEIPYPSSRPEEKKSLAKHFLSSLKKDRLSGVLQVGILNDENKQEIMEVAVLAAECLKLVGEERPNMKEVAIELEQLQRRMMKKHPWINTDQNPEETEYLLHEKSSSIYELGDSSNHQSTGYDSIPHHVQIGLDDGR